MTHAELVQRAARWLRNSRKCAVVLTEPSNAGIEIPDAIGWYGRDSILVECKVSRGDFFADQKKFYRGENLSRCSGHEKYYATPTGLVRAGEIPAGWGLVEVGPKAVRYVVRSPKHQLDIAVMRQELSMLLSELRLHQIVAFGGKVMRTKKTLALFGESKCSPPLPQPKSLHERQKNIDWLMEQKEASGQ